MNKSLSSFFLWKNTPLILSMILFVFLYYIRFKQGGWDIEINLFEHFRNQLDQRINNLLPSPQAELLSGIILGEKKDLPFQLKLALRDTSTLHIVVVSGQNLSLAAGFFLSISGLIKRRFAIILAFSTILFYTILTGAQIPVLRAAVMNSLSFLAEIVGRKGDGLRILIITAGGFLLIKPEWILDLSFQLSFLATFGVLVVAPLLLKYLKFLPVIGQDLAVTLAAQFMIVPVIAQNFHQFSVVGIFANLLVLWTIPFIMVGGFIMLITTFLWNGLAQILSFALVVLLTYFIYIVHFFASLPFAWEYVGEKVWIIWVGYYLILAAVMLLLSNGKGSDFRKPQESS